MTKKFFITKFDVILEFRACTVCKEHVGLTENSVSYETCDVLYHVRCTNIDIEMIEDNSEAYLGCTAPW